MFITPAYAQAAGGGEANLLLQFLPFIAMIAIFWFLLIRPQQKKMKEHQAKIASVRRGDEVVTGGGIVGKITKVNDGDVEVEIAKDVRIKVIKGTIADVVSKTEPAANNTVK